MIGNKYWCIQVDIETLAYGDDHPPTRPWLGVVTETYPTPQQTVILSRFSKETGEVDRDSNASAVVAPENLFETEREAFEAFKDRIQAYFTHKYAQLANLHAIEMEYINKKQAEFSNAG